MNIIEPNIVFNYNFCMELCYQIIIEAEKCKKGHNSNNYRQYLKAFKKYASEMKRYSKEYEK